MAGGNLRRTRGDSHTTSGRVGISWGLFGLLSGRGNSCILFYKIDRAMCRIKLGPVYGKDKFGTKSKVNLLIITTDHVSLHLPLGARNIFWL
jgi:hypothetical protein